VLVQLQMFTFGAVETEEFKFDEVEIEVPEFAELGGEELATIDRLEIAERIFRAAFAAAVAVVAGVAGLNFTRF
jgi:hypothetical protein